MSENPLTKPAAALTPLLFKLRRIWVSTRRRLHSRLEFQKSDDDFRQLFLWIDDETPSDVVAVLNRAEEMANELAGLEQDTFCSGAPAKVDGEWVFRRLTSPVVAQTLMYQLARILRPHWCVEMGSAFGITSLAIAAAIDRNGEGHFDGIEYEKWKAEPANRMLAPFKIHTGTIEEVFPRLLSETNQTLDLCYVDALHTYSDMVEYERLLGLAAGPGSVAVFDDIDFSRNTERFWRELVEKVSCAALLDGRWGIVRY